MNDLNYGDDNFNFDPSAFEFGGQETLPTPGEYSITGKLVKKTDRTTGQVVTAKDGSPVLVVQRATVVDPENGGSFGLFAEISTGSYPSKSGKLANKAIEAIGSIDMNLLQELSGVSREDLGPAAADILEREMSGGAALRVKFGLQGTDSDAAKAEIRNKNLTDKQDISDVWKRHRFYTKAFKRADGKGYLTSITAPSGNTVQGRLVIDGFVPANKPGKSGPYTR
jgi:hypothetical protein